MLMCVISQVKHAHKATLTASSAGGSIDSTAPHPRTATQVLANSLAASVLIILHAYFIRTESSTSCLTKPQGIVSLIPHGIMSHYAAVAADTFSSELGILASTQPYLITDLSGLLSLRPKQVPRGTNGGVTTLGLAAGAGGGAIIAFVSVLITPFCHDWTTSEILWLFLGMTACGLMGSIIDSVMGGLLQASVIDTVTGKVIEGDGGEKVAYLAATSKDNGQPGRKVLVGADVLSNNGVNFAMATTMSFVPMAVLWLLV